MSPSRRTYIGILVALALVAPVTLSGAAVADKIPGKASVSEESAGAPGTPTNDHFANGAALVSSATGTNRDATAEAGEPRPCLMGSRTLWWYWTAPESGMAEIHTRGSNFDTVLAVYTGDAVNALTPVGCNDDSIYGLQSQIKFTATAGVVYRVQVGGYSTSTGNVALAVVEPPPRPVNDARANATSIRVPSTSTVNTHAATVEMNEPASCAPVGGTVWYSWVADPQQAVVVTVNTFGSTFDTVLAVHEINPVTGSSLVACNDDTSGIQSAVTFAAIPGFVYQIQVGGYQGATGDLVLNVGSGP